MFLAFIALCINEKHCSPLPTIAPSLMMRGSILQFNTVYTAQCIPYYSERHIAADYLESSSARTLKEDPGLRFGLIP